MTAVRSTIDLDVPVDDTFVLRTVGGAEDLLAEDLRLRGSISAVKPLDAQVGGRLLGSLRDLHDCRLYSSLALPLDGTPADDGFIGSLRRSMATGLLSVLIPSDGRPQYRVAAESAEATRTIVRTVERDLAWVNDPSDWAVNLVAGKGRWIAEIGPLYWTRRFGEFERRPWSTNPVLAEVLVRLAKLRAGQRVLDPFCGTGTLLVAAGRIAPGAKLIGSDLSQTSLDLAAVNFARFDTTGQLRNARAERIPEPDRSIDRVVANLPFGKRVGSHDGNVKLYPAALAEITRVLADDGRVVLLTDDKRLMIAAIARTPGLKVVRERLLRFSGVTPTGFVLARTRRR